jgi:hypothetical protein
VSWSESLHAGHRGPILPGRWATAKRPSTSRPGYTSDAPQRRQGLPHCGSVTASHSSTPRSVHAGNGYNVCDNGFKLPLVYLVMFVPLILKEAGSLSLDHLLWRKLAKR